MDLAGSLRSIGFTTRDRSNVVHHNQSPVGAMPT